MFNCRDFSVLRLPRLLPLLLLLLLMSASNGIAQERSFPLQAKRILFLGDSITNDGYYISIIEAQARLQAGNQAGHQGGPHVPDMINLGLSSETCCGLSEPAHPFPRPDVQERIGRALAKLKPDVVVACYGMNDGIYHPLSEDRFAKFQAGVQQIIKKVHSSGAKLVLMTPPAFDPLPLKKKGKLLPGGADNYAWFSIYQDYDSVMKKYAAWEMTLSDQVEMVVDLHTPMNEYVANKRKTNADFTMSGDGVHINHEGHEVLAAAILKAWGLKNQPAPDSGLMKLISQRQKLLHNSWLSEVGHKRPGVKPGKPIMEAQKIARDLETQITAQIETQIQPQTQK